MVLRLLLLIVYVHSQQPSVAICFFGIPRAFNTTLPSILQRLIHPLQAVARVSIYIHTYDITNVTNARSGELNASIRPLDVLQLTPSGIEIEDERAVLSALPPEFCRKHGDPWTNDYRSFDNYMCQLHSLRRITEMMAASRSRPYDAVVFARLDMYYFTPIDAAQVLATPNNTIFIPHFHNFGGANDRFAFGSQSTMELYGRRQLSIHGYCRLLPAHSEKYLLWFLRSNRLTIRRTSILFGRMRANGMLWEQPRWQIERVVKNVSVDQVENGHH